MARYYEETALIGFVKQCTPTINGETTMECVERAIREAPAADVAPKSEVVKNALLELKKQVHDKAIYTNSQDIPNYVNLKVFDAILQNYINNLK